MFTQFFSFRGEIVTSHPGRVNSYVLNRNSRRSRNDKKDPRCHTYSGVGMTDRQKCVVEETLTKRL